MKNLKKIKKIILDGNNCGWSDRGSCLLVCIDHECHSIQFEHLNGAAPDWSSLQNFLLTDRDVRKELIWAAAEYSRVNPVFFRSRTGISGCWDVTLCYSQVGHSWAAGHNTKEAFSLHVSSFNKLNEGLPDFFAGDLLDLLVFAGHEDLLADLNSAKSKAYRRESYRYAKYQHREYELYDSACGCM